MKKQNLINSYIELFPEELYLIGEKIENIYRWEGSRDFREYFASFLQFYREKYFVEPFEKMNKVGLLLSYHLLRGERMSRASFSTIQELIKGLEIGEFGLREQIAAKFLKSVLSAYQDFDPTVNQDQLFLNLNQLSTLSAPRLDQTVMVGDYAGWQKTLYGIDVISSEKLVDEIKTLMVDKDRHKSSNYLLAPEQIEGFMYDFIHLFVEINQISLPSIEIKNIPSYLRTIYPTASALTLNRSDRPQGIYYLNTDKSISVEKLLLITSHEVFGHILHFKLIADYCMEKLRILPYMSRFALTEGVALQAEDWLLEFVSTHPAPLVTLFARYGLEYTTILDSLRRSYLELRVLRYIRYLFENQVYSAGMTVEEAIKHVANNFAVKFDDLKDDLSAYIITPGYGSCYVGGYKQLSEYGRVSNAEFARRIGELGFDSISQLK
jgi:hypothetical protein